MLAAPPQVAPGVELEFCRCKQQQRAGEGGDAVVFQAVHMTWDGTASLAAALEALLRPGLPLEELSLHCHCAFDKQLEVCAAALAPLRVLHITGHSHRDCLEESAAAMLARAPALRSLRLMECPLGGGLPPWLVQRQGLDRLVLQCCGITDLPPGPYLQGKPPPRHSRLPRPPRGPSGTAEWASPCLPAASAACLPLPP